MSEVVLDASALLALLNDEDGAKEVEQVLAEAVISTVNLAEVVTRLALHGMPESDIRSVLGLLGLTSLPFDEEMAFQSGLLSPLTRAAGLSLGDRACLALAIERKAPALTADRAWQAIDVEVEVRSIR